MIVIYGASGTTGRLIATQLANRGAKLRLAGRDRHRLTQLATTLADKGFTRPDVRVAALGNGSALANAFVGAKVVVNCAGPFSRLGTSVVRASIEAGAHYLDIGAEQGYLRQSFERLESIAHKAGVVCVSGLAFEIAIGDWAAALAARQLASSRTDEPHTADDDRIAVDQLTLSYAIRRVDRARRGQATSAWGFANPCMVWNHDRWETRAPASQRRRQDFGTPFGEKEAVLFPGGEVITLPRHLNVRLLQTFLWLDSPNPLAWETTRLAPMLAPVLSPLLAGGLGRFVRAQLEAMVPPTVDSLDVGEENVFVIVALAERGFERAQVLIRGRNPLALTCEICSAAALVLVNRPHGNGGVLAPSQVFDPRARLYSLAAQGRIEVEET